MRRATFLLLGAAVVAALLTGGPTIPRLLSADRQKPVDALEPSQREALQNLKSFSDGFAAVAAVAIPSVVTITSEKVIQPARNPMTSDPFFRRFFGDLPESRPFTQHGLGSGVIVRPDGYILTNNHVIRGADELKVILEDGTRLDAEVVGTDSRTDLAVLRVARSDLTPMQFGDSDKLRIGEWVMAVGSPFSENLQTTTTAGIVSAKGRSGMRLTEYEDFIQTDAAINPGNSGGALVDLDGELVGINSAIVSRTGGSNGIGFAIPSNLALEVMSDLIDKGKVTRGWLGVGIQNVTPDLAEAMDLDNAKGILVTSVLEDGPAAKAGMKQGDVITEFNGETMKDMEQLRFTVARAEPETSADLKIVRDGRTRDIRIKLGEYPESGDDVVANAGEGGHELGLTLAPITPELERQYELETSSGLVVTSVEAGSAADDARIQPGDVVTAVDKEQVNSMKSYRKALDDTKKGKPVLLQIDRRGNTFFVALRPE